MPWARFVFPVIQPSVKLLLIFPQDNVPVSTSNTNVKSLYVEGKAIPVQDPWLLGG
jgi:hypothetical protein